jgi:hypothetical protein
MHTIDVGDLNIKPLEFARQRHAANNAAVEKPGSSSTAEMDADAKWLAAEIKTLPGYAEFDTHRHKVQQNTGVVASWKFIALVSGTYFGWPSHIPVRNLFLARMSPLIFVTHDESTFFANEPCNLGWRGILCCSVLRVRFAPSLASLAENDMSMSCRYWTQGHMAAGMYVSQ